jgi:predicted CoA-binding protein
VVGASPKPERYANQAMRLVAQHGHHEIPINPAFDEIERRKMLSECRISSRTDQYDHDASQ